MPLCSVAGGLKVSRLVPCRAVVVVLSCVVVLVPAGCGFAASVRVYPACACLPVPVLSSPLPYLCLVHCLPFSYPVLFVWAVLCRLVLSSLLFSGDHRTMCRCAVVNYALVPVLCPLLCSSLLLCRAVVLSVS